MLVATDIAARGIDVNELAAVVNYELPNVPETYVHRIGRTGRAGRGGVAVSFCNFDELAYLKDIEKLIKKKVPVVEDHPWPMEIFEATPKKQREPRPPRAERQPQIRQHKNKPAQELPVIVKPLSPPPKPLAEKPLPKPQPKAARPAPKPRPAVRTAVPHLEPIQMEEPVIYKVERPKAVFPPEPMKTVMRRITSEPPRMGRVVAFADGRRGGNRNRTRGKAK